LGKGSGPTPNVKIVNDPNQTDVETVCRELWQAFQGLLSWQWDGRFETALAEFAVDRQSGIRAILERYLTNTWDTTTIGYAPDIVRTINIRVAGLRPQQLLFTSDPNREALVFGAWWPWGDGQTISIRLAPWYKRLPDSERVERIQRFKTWFGV
jgi:hypothetical protein